MPALYHLIRMLNFFLKMVLPRPLFCFLLSLFKHKLQFSQKINVKKCHSSIHCRELNSQPLEHESPPITTRPGLPPKNVILAVNE